MRTYFSNRKNSILKMSSKLKKYQLAILLIGAVSTLVRQLFVFLLDEATEQVNTGKVILGLIFFAIYLLQDVIVDSMRFILQKIQNKQKIISENEIGKKATNVLSKTRKKVIGTDGILSSSVILQNVEKYINNYYTVIISGINITIETIVFLVSIFGLIRISIEKVENVWLFIFVVIFGTVATFLLSYLSISKSRKNYKEISGLREKLRNEQNDLENVDPINDSHSTFMIENYCQSKLKMMENEFQIFSKRAKNNFWETIIISSSIITVVAISLIKKDLSHFSSGDFLSLVAFATIFGKTLTSIKSFTRNFSSFMYTFEETKTYKETFDNIMFVYDKEVKKQLKNVSENVLVIPQFTHSFSNFSIENNKELIIEKGRLILLNGKSGAGKSTLIDLLVGEIGNIGYNISTIKYFKEAKLGSKSILEEIVLGLEIDTDKLENILKGLCLYENFSMKANKVNQDLISYMQNIYKTDLSTGLDQRVLLARVLYQLNETIDLLLFDEPIGNVDQETAIKIVEYIKSYCNCDRSRFVMIATHQYSWIKQLVDTVINFNTVTEIKTVIS